MNIIEVVQQVLSEFPKMSELNQGIVIDFTKIGIDFTKKEPDNCGLYPTGDQILKNYITGNQDRQHNFVLYAKFQSFEEYDRLANSTFLLDLNYWLEKAAKNQEVEATIDEKTVKGHLTKLTSANGMFYGYDNDSPTSPGTYQLQIYAQYRLESEVL